MPFVLDASVAGTWIFEDEKMAATDALLHSLQSDFAYCPALWPTQIGNTMLTGIKRGRVSAKAAKGFLDMLNDLKIQVMPPTSFYSSLLQAAIKHGLTAYDATYLELAIEQGVPLATLDKQLRAAARTAGVPLLLHEPS